MFFRTARLLCDSRLPLEDEPTAAEVPLDGDEKLKESECTDAADVATKPPAAAAILLSGLWQPRWPPLLTFGF